jgi:hypothetical protein
MHWLKRIIPALLVLAALAVVLATAFSDHEDDYGRVPVPAGGTVQLPRGTVKVFYEQIGQTQQSIRLENPITFEVRSAAGGPPLEQRATAGDSEGELQVQRSQELGALGSIAELEVTAAGTYVVGAVTGPAPGGSSLSFGTDPFSAVLDRWRLLAILLVAAVLIALIPLPKRRHRQWDEGAEAGWSSDPRTPYG